MEVKTPFPSFPTVHILSAFSTRVRHLLLFSWGTNQRACLYVYDILCLFVGISKCSPVGKASSLILSFLWSKILNYLLSMFTFSSLLALNHYSMITEALRYVFSGSSLALFLVSSSWLVPALSIDILISTEELGSCDQVSHLRRARRRLPSSSRSSPPLL